LKYLTPLRAAACSSGLAMGALAEVSSVVIIGTFAPREVIASIARGRSSAARSGAT
jgi:hypothetical protein